MLGVLKFKKSLFAGVLDGGEKEVFLGGSRLTKFMETVEAATTAIPAPPPEEEASEPETPEPRSQEHSDESAPAPKPTPAPTPTPEATAGPRIPAPAPTDPWAGLLQAGMAILQQFAAPAGSNGQAGHSQAALPGRVCKDEQTGESYLRLPVPPTELVEQAVGALALLLQSLRR
jgi:hypothetical protein